MTAARKSSAPSAAPTSRTSPPPAAALATRARIPRAGADDTPAHPDPLVRLVRLLAIDQAERDAAATAAHDRRDNGHARA